MEEPPQKCHDLAKFIWDWMVKRNGAELFEPLMNMRVIDHDNFLGELAMILQHGGRPPNWTK